ncbi:hypothetical protein ES332_A07G180500v1 [Gossypium tomentosum]|uniref:Secreted protein n=1 Tax=Gossypium tomentosum TaxID=34277 RepID=A0A5D2PTT6_GOSTO|nr:hypothetical protein ES332_A07G180500v1 [Gossypium tomentosum]
MVISHPLLALFFCPPLILITPFGARLSFNCLSLFRCRISQCRCPPLYVRVFAAATNDGWVAALKTPNASLYIVFLQNQNVCCFNLYLVGDPSWVLLVAIFYLFEVVVWCLLTGH